jgi:hypothetical protein
MVIDSEPPGSTTNHLITPPDLDLLYFEQPVGGHIAPQGVYWSREVYDWMFSHVIGVPEPAAVPLMTAVVFAAFTRQRRAFSR